MKKFLWCTAAMILYLFPFVQGDSLSFARNDTLRSPDTLIEKFSIAKNDRKLLVYKLKPAIDIPVFAVTGGWSAYAFTKIYSKEPSSEETILSLDVNDINGFDRWAVRPYSESIGKTRNYIFYGAMPLSSAILSPSKRKICTTAAPGSPGFWRT